MNKLKQSKLEKREIYSNWPPNASNWAYGRGGAFPNGRAHVVEYIARETHAHGENDRLVAEQIVQLRLASAHGRAR